MKNKDITTTKKSKEYKSWRKSIEKDGITKSVSVEECENGFIICISEYGEGKKGWYSEDKKFISTKNPLEGEKELKEEDNMMESIEAVLNF